MPASARLIVEELLGGWHEAALEQEAIAHRYAGAEHGTIAAVRAAQLRACLAEVASFFPAATRPDRLERTPNERNR